MLEGEPGDTRTCWEARDARAGLPCGLVYQHSEIIIHISRLIIQLSEMHSTLVSQFSLGPEPGTWPLMKLDRMWREPEVRG